MFPKPTRVKDKELRRLIRGRPCLVCGASPSDAAHLKTVGSGGGDTVDNLIPLCRVHHVEQHAIGIDTFLSKYSLQCKIV